uniref:G_PROTEIN_RECEP_F1_2 domain-containing protein n=1 Tax=Macrostomum lignano TaxID=282301 RepID=A0A1I8FJI5_9PLAT
FGRQSRTELRGFLTSLAVADLLIGCFLPAIHPGECVQQELASAGILCKLVCYFQLVAVTSIGSTGIATGTSGCTLCSVLVLTYLLPLGVLSAHLRCHRPPAVEQNHPRQCRLGQGLAAHQGQAEDREELIVGWSTSLFCPVLVASDVFTFSSDYTELNTWLPE